MFSTGERRTTAIHCAVVSLAQNMCIIFEDFAIFNCFSAIL